MPQRVVLHKREREEGRSGDVIVVALSPIAKGIHSLLFDYSLPVKQGVLKELLLRHHNVPPSLPDTRL